MSQFPWEEYRQKKDPSDPPQGSAASDPAAADPPKEEAPQTDTAGSADASSKPEDIPPADRTPGSSCASDAWDPAAKADGGDTPADPAEESADPKTEDADAPDSPPFQKEHTAPPPYWGYPPYGAYPPYGPPPPYNQAPPPASPPNPPPWANVPPEYIPYVPYHGPASGPSNAGSRVLVGVLIGLASAFVLGFFIWGIVFSALPSAGVSEPLPESVENGSQEEPGQGGGQTGTPSENPVGPATAPGFAGLSLVQPGDTLLQPSEIYRTVAPSLVSVRATVQDTQGQEEELLSSGVILTTDGYIITSASSIGYSRTTPVTVALSDQTEYEAVIVGYDNKTDLAVLKIDASGLHAAVFADSQAVAVGDSVFPLGASTVQGDAGSISSGVVFSLGGQDNAGSYLVTDAAWSVGNVGGALVNAYGQVVGIGSLAFSDSYDGMFLAVSSETVKQVADDLIRQGYVGGRTRLGITGTSVTSQQALYYDLPQGVMIYEISQGSSLEDTEAQVGDVITQIDGQEVLSMEDVYQILGGRQPGDTVEITLYREGQGEFQVSVTLLEDQGETQSN